MTHHRTTNQAQHEPPSPATVAALEKIPSAARRMGVSTSQFYRLAKRDGLRIIKVSERASAVPAEDVTNWILARIAASNERRCRMLTARRFVEMSLGRSVFRHTLGVETPDECGWNISDLPAPSAIAPGLRFAGSDLDYCRLGGALAESFFKLLRADESCRAADFDGGVSAALYAEKLRSDELRDGFLFGYFALAELALTRPHRLPELCRRLEALDNAALEERCYRAFCGECNDEADDLVAAVARFAAPGTKGGASC